MACPSCLVGFAGPGDSGPRASDMTSCVLTGAAVGGVTGALFSLLFKKSMGKSAGVGAALFATAYFLSPSTFPFASCKAP